MPTCARASASESPARMPVREKSSTPETRIMLQPASSRVQFSGTDAARQTRESSSSVRERKKKIVVRPDAAQIGDLTYGEFAGDQL